MALTAQETQMIRALFERIHAQSNIQRDPEADTLIAGEMRTNPAAAYIMTQTIMMQEHAMQMSAEKIRDLEAEVQRLRVAPPAAAPQPQSGGFFGGRASVPPTGPWGQSAQNAPQPPMPQSTGWGQPPAAAPWGGQPQAQQGGGFLRSALTTAAGVAGGALLFNGISKMFGGGGEGQSHSSLMGTDAASANQELGNMTSSFGSGTADRQFAPEQDYDQAADDGFDGGGDDWA